MKKLALMVEGQGDVEAVKRLVARSLQHFHPDWTSFFYLDDAPMKVGAVPALLSPKENVKLIRYTQIVAKNPDIGGVLIVLDGDADFFMKPSGDSIVREPFCPVTTACYMTELVRSHTSAGKTFSCAVVFANQEFESWILAGHPKFSDKYADSNLEKHPRNAKGEIKKIDPHYNEAINQKDYIADLNLESLLEKMRSFRRLKHALEEIYHSIREGEHTCSPS